MTTSSNAARLAGGNTINQAQKPSKAPISIPVPPGENPIETIDSLTKKLEEKSSELLACQEHLSAQGKELADAKDRLAKITTRLDKATMALSRLGVGLPR